jgi:hypothetical protein
LHLSPYTKQQFLDIGVKVCPRLKEVISRIIAEEVWKQGGKDIRDVMGLGKLLRKDDGPEEVKRLVRTLAKYTNSTDAT